MLNGWERLPEELKAVGQWCIAAPDKSPYTTAGFRAKVTDPAHWTDWYSAAHTAHAWGSGIGFVLSEDDDFACIDLDVKDDTTPEQLARYQRIINAFDSYTELSRSGKGVHIWVKGRIDCGARRDGVEVYSKERFIICTGNAINAKPIENRQELLEILVAEIRAAQAAHTDHIELVEQDETETDEAVWTKAAEAANGDKFQQLWAGVWKELHYPSQSEADLSLLSMLCFYSRSNAQVRRLFRLSGLGQRDKAQKNNRYLDRTLAMIRGRQAREDQQAEQGKELTQQLIKMVERKIPQKLLEVKAPATLDWPPGVVGELAKWFYSIAPRPVREVALVSALGLMAGVYGRAFNINKSGLNLYMVLVARSAIGKEAMHSSISKLIHIMLNSGAPAFSTFVDFADYASGPALVKAIADRSSFINVAGEWGRKLRKMSDDHVEGPMSSLRTAMTNLYQKSGAGTIVGGIGYSDKEKDVKSVNGVAYSMIGETTPDTFYESLTNTMMQDGFMSRFIIVEYNGLRPQLNMNTDAALPESLFYALINGVEQAMNCPPGSYRDVALSPEAQELLDEFNLTCDENINGTDDESWRQMWNRAHLKALKVAGILAVSDNPRSPVVSKAHAEWALTLIKRDIKIMGRKIADGDVGDGDVVRERKIMAVLFDYLYNPIPSSYKIPDDMRKQGVVARKYLQIRLQRTNSFIKHRAGQSAALDSTIRSLIDSGYLVELAKDKVPLDWGFHGKCYRIMSLPDVIG